MKNKQILGFMFYIHKIYNDVFDADLPFDDPERFAFDKSVEYIVKLFNDCLIDTRDFHVLIKYLEDMMCFYEDVNYVYDYSN